MHTRRLSSFLLGAWLAASLFMSAVAAGNFRAVDRLLDTPSKAASEHIKKLGKDSTRALLRYQVSELNRYYFDQWELVQLCLGALLAVVLLFATNGNRLAMALSVFMVLLVVIQHWLVGPQVLALGRLLDFTSANAPLAQRTQFMAHHRAYLVVEGLKLLAGVVLTVRLLVAVSAGRRRRRTGEAEPVLDA